MSNISNISIPDIVKEDKSITEVIASLDEVHNLTAQYRAKLTDKIFGAVDQMTIDPEGDPEKLEAQIRLIDQTDKVLVNREKAMINRVTVRLKNKETNLQDRLSSALTAKILREVKTSYVVNDTQDVDLSAIANIEAQLNGLEKIDYNDGALRTDSKDIS